MGKSSDNHDVGINPKSVESAGGKRPNFCNSSHHVGRNEAANTMAVPAGDVTSQRFPVGKHEFTQI
jgi:hypothetical protein